MTLTARKSLSLRKRFAVLEAGGFRCHYCGRPPGLDVRLQVDHVIPLAEGGTNDHANLVPSCTACNLGKADRRLQAVEWTPLRRRPDEPAGARCVDELHPGPWSEYPYPIGRPARALVCPACRHIVAFRYLPEVET